MCGGIGEDKVADEDAQSILDESRDQIVRELGAEPAELKAVRYATQTVAGFNYFIKAHLGNKQFIHVRIYKALPCNGGAATVQAIQKEKSEHEPVIIFYNN